jgi:hypothetical protein
MKRFAIVSVLVLAACTCCAYGAGLTPQNMEPMKGDKMVYKVFEQNTMTFENTPVTLSTHGVGTETSEVVALSKGTGKSVFLMLTCHKMTTTNNTTKKTDESASQSLETCRSTQRGLWVDANWARDDKEDSSVDVGRTFLEMRLPCEPGTKWRGGCLAYKDGFTVRPESLAGGYEDVDVPAGTFKNCLKVTSSCPDGVDGYVLQDNQRLEVVSGDMHVTSWYYPRIGVVKEISTTTLRVRPEGQDEAAILKMETGSTTALAEYKLGK